MRRRDSPTSLLVRGHWKSRDLIVPVQTQVKKGTDRHHQKKKDNVCIKREREREREREQKGAFCEDRERSTQKTEK
ncbi:hypothetical protein Mapa_016025 [Marchantia paleacea]|nr:hypothetical protein Mapa_016025 [Marchantia paleacea]